MTADEQRQVGLRHHPVGRPAGVAAHHAHRQRMVFGDAALGIERRRHRNIQQLRQPHHLRLRPRRRNAAPGDDHRTLRLRQDARRLPHPLRFRFGTERRPLRERLLHNHLRIQNAVGNHIPGDPRKVQMRRQRLPGGNLPERLPQQMGQLRRRLHLGAVLGNRCEGPRVLNLLVGIAVPVHRRAVPGDGDNRRHPQVGVLQPGGQVGGAHRLGEAQPRLAGNPRVGIRHIRRRLLAVADNPPDAHILHLHQRAPDDGGDKKHMGNAVLPQRFGQKTGAGHRGHRTPSRFVSTGSLSNGPVSNRLVSNQITGRRRDHDRRQGWRQAGMTGQAPGYCQPNAV